MILTYLLLVPSCYQGPLVLPFIDLDEAYEQLPRAALWYMLAEQLELLVDIRTSIEALYYQRLSKVWGGGTLSASFDIKIGVK